MNLVNIVVDRKYINSIKHIIRRYYSTGITISDRPIPRVYNIELRDGFGFSRAINIDYSIVYVNARKISTLSQIDLLKKIEYGKALIRHTISWDPQYKYYRLDPMGHSIKGYNVHPSYDAFLIYSRQYLELLRSNGLNIDASNILALKKFRGVHELYIGDTLVGKVIIPHRGNVSIEVFKDLTSLNNENNMKLFIKYNKEIIKLHTEITMSFLKRIESRIGKPDKVFVSFSGGKDSVVVLDIALKLYNKDQIYPVYVDTGVEFPETIEYVKTVEDYYDVPIVRTYAGIDKKIAEKGLPSRENRWCTNLKQRAFINKVRELSRRDEQVYVLIGDRDVESVKRGHRPPVIKKNNHIEVAPIKMWSTILVQTYILVNNVPLNPLYEYGFYRIGCYICPALRSLEISIMRNKLFKELKDLYLFREYLSKVIENE